MVLNLCKQEIIDIFKHEKKRLVNESPSHAFEQLMGFMGWYGKSVDSYLKVTQQSIYPRTFLGL